MSSIWAGSGKWFSAAGPSLVGVAWTSGRNVPARDAIPLRGHVEQFRATALQRYRVHTIAVFDKFRHAGETSITTD